MVPFGADRAYVNRLARRRGLRDDRGRREIERDAEHVRVLDGEPILSVELVGLTAKGAADHLFAEQLGTEGPHPEHVRHGVGIPAFA